MAQYIITIDDRDGGVSLKMDGPPVKGPAHSLANSLLTVAPHLLRVLMLHGFTVPECNCQRCQVLNPANPNGKPTLH
jgi:hypothetical protein